MRKVNNFFGLIGYVFLTISGVTYIFNKWLDYFYKEPPIEEPDYPIKHIKKHTVYPDGWTDKPSTEDFNKFFSDIHKQLNN